MTKRQNIKTARTARHSKTRQNTRQNSSENGKTNGPHDKPVRTVRTVVWTAKLTTKLHARRNFTHDKPKLQQLPTQQNCTHERQHHAHGKTVVGTANCTHGETSPNSSGNGKTARTVKLHPWQNRTHDKTKLQQLPTQQNCTHERQHHTHTAKQ